MSHARTALVLVILTLAACGDNTGPPITELSIDTLADGSVLVSNPVHGPWDADPDARWRLVESLRIGTATAGGPEAFESINRITIDALDRLWVVDYLAGHVKVFDAEGRHVRTIGRQGEGPGEFIRLSSVLRGPNGNMWIADDRLRRYEIFDTAGTRIGGHRYVTQWSGAWIDRGLFISSDGWYEDKPVYRVYRLGAGGRLEADGRVLELPEEPPDPPMMEFTAEGATVTYALPIPFAPKDWSVTGRELDMWWSDGRDHGERYEIRHIDLESGRTLRTVVRQYEPSPISDSARVAAVSALLESVRMDHNVPWVERPDEEAIRAVPHVYSPLTRFYRSGDGTLWVLRALAGDVVGFDVFDEEGRFLGQPELPDGFRTMVVRRITRDAMYLIDTDELGVDYVVRLDIVRPGGSGEA